MANDDVIVKFRADVSEMQSNIESAKKSVTDFSKETERAQNKIISANKKTASSFNGLGNSINQLTRELPAFTYSAQTGFLALSNNIPALADQIQMLKVKNQELVASGQKSIPVWKSLTSALFSWQTGLSLGITLITVYWKEIFNFVKTLFTGIDATERAKEKQEQYNKELERSIELSKQLKDGTVNYKRSLDEVLGVLIKGGNKSELSITVLKEALSELNQELSNLSEQNTIIPPNVVINSEKEFYQKRREFFNKEKADILANIKLIEKELGIKEKGLKTAKKEKEVVQEKTIAIGAYQKLLNDIAFLEEKISNDVVTATVDPNDVNNLKDLKSELEFIKSAMDALMGIGPDEDLETPIIKTNEELEKQKTTLEKIINLWDKYGNTIKEIEGNVMQAIQNQNESKIQAIDEMAKYEEEKAKMKLEKGLINEEKYNKELEKIEKEKEKKEREVRQKQAQIEKNYAMYRATLEGGIAIIKAGSNPIELALAIATLASQIALIQSAPIPQFEKGGWVEGKRHRDGGVLIEAEDKEFINNRISSQKYSEELESMNNLSFEKLNYRKHIMPAIRKEREKIYSAINSSFNDSNLLMSDRETRQILRDIRDGVKQNSGYSKSLRFK